METIWQKIADVLLLSRLEKRWQKAARALAIVVVFCTTYMLILPAITIENETYCGFEEHTHNDSCYVVESRLICGFDSAEISEEETTEESTTAEQTTEEETTEEATTEEETTEEETTEEETTEEETTEEETTEEETTEEETTEEETTEEKTTEEETTEEETTEEETTEEETTEEETTEEETTEEETTEEETTEEETTEEETTEEETTEEETTEEETTEEESTSEETTEEENKTSENIHIHSEECYEYTKTLVCTLEEHTHEEICFIEALMYNTNLMNDTGDDEYAIEPLADGDNSVTKVDFDTLDGVNGTYYVVYTYYNNNYYAIDGNGNAVAITVNSDGTVESASMGDNLYWNFSLQSGTTYVIQNIGTSRYMHSYYNSASDYGVTTAGDWSSVLESTGSGSNETFAVRSNSNYSLITTSSGRVVFQTTGDSEDAAQFFIAKVPPDTYHVWFDGTCGGLMSLYESPDTYLAVPTENPTISLPETWTSPSKYHYVLNGWYDIKNHKYYKPGAEATITKNTVFYADWVAATYDVGIVDDDNISLVAPSLDTNSFIRTDMFDYSAVFNMQAVTHTGSVSASSHNENWSVVTDNKVPYNDADSLGFIFRDWDSNGYDISYPSNVIRLNENQGDEITSGITDYVYNMSGQNIIDLLFKPDTQVIGKNYVGQANYLYQFMEEGSANYDGTHNGYYYYDATLNAASYNQTNQRFYIYNYLERTSDSYKDSCDSNGIKTAEGGYSDFLPFNSPYANNHNDKTIVRYADGDDIKDNYQYDAKATNQESNIANAGTNYWFGMKSEIEFYLPDDTGTVDAYQNYGNISSHGQHMTFEFSGDDDLWVFIDGELVMDIGGLHGVMKGKIDFSTGTITTSQANDVLATGEAAEVNTTFMPPIKAGDHTLTVYYMERGGSQSNCAIYFNITPRYGMELVKNDSVTGQGLDGAVFEVFTDISCTEDYKAELWKSEEEYQNNGKTTNKFTAIDGKVSFWGISAGKVYYIKETASPPGYPVTDDIIRLSMNNLGNSLCSVDTLRGEDGYHTDGFEIVGNLANESHQQIAITVANQEDTSNKRNVAVTKKWAETDESLIPESVTVYLTANGQNTGKSAVLSEVNDWTYLWIDLPIKDSAGNEIIYSVYEEQAEDFYTDVAVSDQGTYINAWVQTDSFYDGGTFLIVDKDEGDALSVNSSGDFEWIDFETAKSSSAAQWIVNADGMGFHVINETDYHIILEDIREDGTSEFVPMQNGNRILYYNNFMLAARYNNTYYYLDDDFSANTEGNLDLELYINMDILVHEEDEEEKEEEDETVKGEDTAEDGQIFVTQFTVTNTHIDEEKRTSFNVEKKWEDGATNHINDSITIRLYADGVDTGRTLTLNHTNGWKGSFDGLLYEDNDGNKIEYTVIEDWIEGYHPEYSEITEEEGGTKTETIVTENWSTVTSLTAGYTYRFVNSSGYALTANADNTSVSTAADNKDDLYQRWVYQNNKLKNVGKSTDTTAYYLYQTTSGTRTLSVSTSTNNTNTNFSLTTSNNNIKMRIGSNNNSYRYITLGNGSVSLGTSSSSATTPTIYRLSTTSETVTTYMPTTYKITVTNIKVYYVLPETGGTGTYHLYIIGGLLITLSAVFLLCLYKKDRGRRRRDFG